MTTPRATSGSDADVDDADAMELAMRRRHRRRARASRGALASPSPTTTSGRIAAKKVVGDLSTLARRRGVSGSARARATRRYGSDDEDERNRVGRALEESGREGEGGTDAGRRRALEARWRKMRALPRGSRYAKQQCELIEKALEILERGKRNGTRSVEEEDELAGLLKAVKL